MIYETLKRLAIEWGRISMTIHKMVRVLSTVYVPKRVLLFFRKHFLEVDMKLFLTLALSTFSFAAYACPNLNGNWKCTSDTGEVSYSQVVQNGNVFNIHDDGDVDTIIADGVARDVSMDMGDGNSAQGMQVAKCAGSNLMIVQNFESQGGMPAMKVDVSVKQTSGTTFASHAVISAGNQVMAESKESCQRQ